MTESSPSHKDTIGSGTYTLLLIFGVLSLSIAIIVELLTRICMSNFFDPIPTVWHVLAISSVAISNFLVLHFVLYKGNLKHIGFFSLLNAIALVISAYYSIGFLPLIPAGIIGIIFMGIGLCAFTPLAAFISASVLRSKMKAQFAEQGITDTYFWKGLALAVLLLLIIDLPLGLTTLGIQWAGSSSAEKSKQGVQLLRAIGNKDLMLRECYDSAKTLSGPLTLAFALTRGHSEHVSSDEVREIFYKVTGEPFNTYSPPYNKSGALFDFDFDSDQGGTDVGGRLKHLNLVSSTMDGYIKPDEAVSYLEWVMEFKNTSISQQEVRLQVGLPPKAVVSRASLWVNGEEREAAYTGRQKARDAYRNVAIRQRRDPLLVTTDGGDRVLAQAFPVPANGTIKFKLGITVPLKISALDKASMVLPAIYNRNFSIDESLKHAIWVESEKPLENPSDKLETKKIKDSLYRLTGKLTDIELTKPRIMISGSRNPAQNLAWAQLGNKSVLQEITRQKKAPLDSMIIAIDSSVKARPFIDQVVASFNDIPEGKPVGLLMAGEDEIEIPIKAWSPEQKEKFVQTVRNAHYVGGQDNTEALSKAFQELEQSKNADVLWIYAPQPILFSSGKATLEQVINRIKHLPHVTLYELLPGPNKLLNDSNWVMNSETLVNTGNIKDDLSQYFHDAFSEEGIVIKRSLAKQVEPSKGSEHIARLWAQDSIYSLIRENNEKSTKDAIQLASDYHLVTPVSGAVVLESEAQYKENGLKPAEQETVPTIPEPEEWMLMFIVLVFLSIWFIRQRKQSLQKG